MITMSGDQLKRAEQMLQHLPNAMPGVVARSLNRAAESGRTEAVRGVRSQYLVNAGEIRATMDIARASAGNLLARIRSRGRVRPLSQSKITPGSRYPVKQLKARVKRGGGGTIRGAFVARMTEVGFGKGRRRAEIGEGHAGIFHRTDGNASNPIKELFGPSVPQMIGNEMVRMRVEEKEWETLQKRLEHEVSRLLSKG